MINEEWLVYEEHSPCCDHNSSGLGEDELAGLTAVGGSIVSGVLTYGVVVAGLSIAANSHVNGYRQGYKDGVESLGCNESAEVQQFEMD